MGPGEPGDIQIRFGAASDELWQQDTLDVHAAEQ